MCRISWKDWPWPHSRLCCRKQLFSNCVGDSLMKMSRPVAPVLVSTALHVSGEVWGSSQSALCFTPDTMTLLATTIIIFITTCSSLLTVSAEEEVEGRFLFGNPTLGMRWSECQLWLDTTGWCCGWVRSQCSSTCAGRDCATPCSGRCSGSICHIDHPMLDTGIVLQVRHLFPVRTLHLRGRPAGLLHLLHHDHHHHYYYS